MSIITVIYIIKNNGKKNIVFIYVHWIRNISFLCKLSKRKFGNNEFLKYYFILIKVQNNDY